MPPRESRATGRRVVSERDGTRAGMQQQTVQTRLRQQERAPVPRARESVDAEASPTTDSIPTIAAKATQVSRR